VQTANKATSGASSNLYESGWDVVLDINPQFDAGGFNFFVGGSETQIGKARAGLKDLTGDHEEAVAGLKITIGPLEVGGQISGERLRTQSYNSTNYYGNTSWGVAFNVNDDLSISYGEHRSLQTKTKKSGSGVTEVYNSETVQGLVNEEDYNPKSWMRGDSFQVAYTIGGVGLKYAQTDYDNTAYGFDTKAPKENKVLAVSLAF